MAARPSDFCPLDEPHCAASFMCASYPQYAARVCAELRVHYGDKSPSVEVALRDLVMGRGDLLVVGLGDQIADPGEMERTVDLIHSDLLHASLCATAAGGPPPRPLSRVRGPRPALAGGLAPGIRVIQRAAAAGVHTRGSLRA